MKKRWGIEVTLKAGENSQVKLPVLFLTLLFAILPAHDLAPHKKNFLPINEQL
ncbi:MAG: hypothetical protein BWX76_00423 [Candidatus Cloacimonetes bacterium ADurb.Bin089]|nr:MAG: hypothetical protein BWX76_00423 [Candidatus Cloacimonetes bacterium ADurb.Bin089]